MAKQIKDEMTSFLKRDEIDALVSKIARQIEADFDGKPVVIICPLRGSIHFVADLTRKLDLTVRIDFVHLSASERGGVIKIHKDITENIAGKHVIIAEEIIDTGRTLSFLRNRLLSAGPASLKIATLLDKPARRELPIRADYIGRTIEDRYVVGYGMDSGDLCRNYPDIYLLRN